MNVREYLEQVKKLDELIQAKSEERKRIMHIATDCSAKLPDGMPFSNTGLPSQRLENAVIDLATLNDEIDKELVRYINIRAKVILNLEKLPAKEYGALHRHYIQFKSWEKVAEEMGYSTMHIYRIHRNGLKILRDVIEC